MHKSLAALTLALLVGLLTIGLSGVAGAALSKDYTKGKGEDSSGGRFKFKVQDLDGDPATEAAKGNLTYQFIDTFSGEKVVVQVEVQCLRVVDDTASFLGPVKKSSEPGFLGQTISTHVFDSGQPDGQGDQFVTGLTTPQPCPDPLAGPPISDGDIVVRDVV